MSNSAVFIHGARLASGELADIVIQDGVINGVGGDLRAPSGAELLDGSGLLALPGAVDPHVHFSEPGARSHWEGWATGSAAAAAGGITTVVEMPLNASPPTVDVEAFDAKVASATRSSVVDFGLWGGVIPGNRAELPGLAARGVIAFKAFMSTSGSDDFPASDDLTLYEAMATIAELGVPFALHAESDTITAKLAARAGAQGRDSVRDYLDSRPPVAETEAIARAIELADVTGCPLHIVHVSTTRGVALVAQARARGQDVTCEVTSHHLILDEQDAERIGAPAKCAPPLRPAAELEALWGEVRSDETLFVVSDHSPSPPDLKTSTNAFEVWGGIAGMQSTVELVLTEGVDRGKLPMSRVPDVLAGAAARRFRLPGKGALAAGMDGDLALIEIGSERQLDRSELLDRHKLSPFVGWTLNAQVRHTLRRGEFVYRDRELVANSGGRLLRPSMPPG